MASNSPGKDTETFSVNISKAALAALTDTAQVLGKTRNQLIREIFDGFLADPAAILERYHRAQLEEMKAKLKDADSDLSAKPAQNTIVTGGTTMVVETREKKS